MGALSGARDKILRAAERVFAEHGFGAPVELIASEAGVSKGLVFWYFKTKEELVREVAARSLPSDVLRSCLEGRLRGAELLECIGERYMEKYGDPHMRMLLLHAISLSLTSPEVGRELRSSCMKLLGEVARRAYGGTGPAELVKAMAFLGALLCYAINPPDVPARQYIKLLVEVLG